MPVIAFRADGGPEIGMGHIMRCLALASAFPDDVEILFITKNNKNVVNLINQKSFKVLTIDVDSDNKSEVRLLKKIIKDKNIDFLITDSYKISQEYLIEVSKELDKLVSIHDLTPFPSPADIVINGNIYAPKLNYQSYYGGTKFLLGPAYTLFRDEFKALPPKRVTRQVKNILVTVGGSDRLNLTPKIIRAFKLMEERLHENDFKCFDGNGQFGGYCKLEELSINIVIGPLFTNISDIKEEMTHSSLKISLLYNVQKMSGLMINSDLAISAGGSTLYELAATGTPTLTLLQAENQVLLAEEMERVGVSINLGFGDCFDEEEIYINILEMIRCYQARLTMSRKGQKIFDGQGPERCARVILCDKDV